jgi:hypothetical protein
MSPAGSAIHSSRTRPWPAWTSCPPRQPRCPPAAHVPIVMAPRRLPKLRCMRRHTAVRSLFTATSPLAGKHARVIINSSRSRRNWPRAVARMILATCPQPCCPVRRKTTEKEGTACTRVYCTTLCHGHGFVLCGAASHVVCLHPWDHLVPVHHYHSL